MRRVHAALLAVLAFGLILGGTAVAGGVDAGVTDSADTQPGYAVDHPQQGAVASTAVECSYPVEVTDATGETVNVTEEPEEVVALGASDAQVLWALDADEKVTGLPMTGATAYLENRAVRPGGEERTDIAGDFGPVVEEVVSLDPDLVVAASAMFPDDVQAIRDAGLTVYHAENEQTLEDVYSYIEQVGQLVNACDEAEQTVAEMQDTVGFIEGAVADEERPSVYYAQVPGEGWTAGQGTVEHDMITTAGGENVGAELGVEFYDQVSEEGIVAQDPDWIVVSEGSGDLPESLSTTTAVQEDQIVEVDANAISQPGPRMTEPLETMAEAFHPGALDAARDNGSDDADNGSDDSDDDGDNGADDDTDDGSGSGDDGGDDGSTDDGGDDGSTDDGGDDGSTDDDGTGLTVVAALVALSALVVAMRQREA